MINAMKSIFVVSTLLLSSLAPALADTSTGTTIAPSTSTAGDKPYISVGSAKARKSVIAMPKLAGSPDLSKSVGDTVENALRFTDLFTFLAPAAFVEKTGGIAPNTFKMTDWSSIKTEFLIKAAATKDEGSLVLEGYLYDVAGGRVVLSKRYRASSGEARLLGLSFANDIMTALTGAPGIFLTKIAMSCDRGKPGQKEIYIMDFDGTNVKQVTSHRSIAIAPAWSPDGNKLAYSLYSRHRDNNKNIDLYELDFKTNKFRLLSNKKGINSGAAYSPDGKTIALTTSFLGNPEIFLLNTADPARSNLARLTSSMGFDVDPSWSPDGKKLAFVSSRSGMPMIFSMGIDGSSVNRLTFAGRYNATPSWSATGNKIAFAGWLDGRFDIFTMNPDGTKIERLTKNQGNNEDPNMSPDGNFIVFASNRVGQSNIYVMNIDGSFTRRLTFGLGNCASPKWSMPPR